MSEREARLASGRAIVTYGRSVMAVVIARSLASRGVEVIGCDDVGMTVLSFSKYVGDYFTHPKWQDEPEAYLDAMVEKARAFKPSDDRPYVLIPSFQSMAFLARHRDRFEGLIEIAAPDADAVDAVESKDRLAETAKAAGARIPETVCVASEAALEAAAERLGYPFILKPVAGVGGRGVTKVDSEEQFESAFAALKGADGLAQEFARGDDYCVAVLFEKGVLKASMAYRNLRQWPAPSGAGVFRETVDDAPFRPTAEKLLGSLGWNGVAEIDFRWTGDDKDAPMLIEVNPRFWAGLSHSVETGADFPWAAYELAATGEFAGEVRAEVGARTQTPGFSLLATIQDVAKSDLHFDRLKDGWRHAMKSVGEGEVLTGLRILGRNMKRAFNRNDAAFRLLEAHDEGREADSDVSFHDDKLANLGVLFIASSLIRHGELPPEVKG